MRNTAFALTALSLALVACNSDSTDVTNVTDEPVAATTPSPSATTPAASTDAPAIFADLGVTPLPNGLAVPGGSTATFGMTREQVQQVLGSVGGELKIDGRANECGLTSSAYEGIALNYRDDDFVGYTLNAPYVPALNRDQMLADGSVSEMDSTIDGEFTVGSDPANSVGGVFVGDEVRALYAGENCIAR